MNEEQRLAHISNLVALAGQRGAVEHFARRLNPVVAMLLSEGAPAYGRLALVQVLLHSALSVVYATIGTDEDTGVRTVDDIAALVAGEWDSIKRGGEDFARQLEERGMEVPEVLKAKLRETPSDATLRPAASSVKSNAASELSLNEILGLINSIGDTKPQSGN